MRIYRWRAGWTWLGMAAALMVGVSQAAAVDSAVLPETDTRPAGQQHDDGDLPPDAGGAVPVTGQEALPPNTALGYQEQGAQLNPVSNTTPPNAANSEDQPPGSVLVSGNVTPQAPEGLSIMPEAQGLVAYKPIDQSLLPTGSAIAPPAPNAAQANLPTATNLGAPAINWGPYTLGPDDVVHIAVRNQREFTGVYAIGRDGKIQFGFIGDIDANGLTKEELARTVEASLRRYIRVPSVHVTIVGFNSKAIYILGRVARPGKYAMRGDSIKIRDAVIAAGLVVQHAKLRRVHIVKSDADTPTYRIVDLQKVLYKGQMEENVDLVQGDIVVIPTTIWGGINDFLSSLLSPVGHAGSVAALAAL